LTRENGIPQRGQWRGKNRFFQANAPLQYPTALKLKELTRGVKQSIIIREGKWKRRAGCLKFAEQKSWLPEICGRAELLPRILQKNAHLSLI
jgi:hypothetical protein